MNRARCSAAVAIAVTLTLVATACSGDDDDSATTSADGSATEATEPSDPVEAAQQRVSDAESAVAAAEEALATAHGDFCEAAQTYVEKLDRYGKLFTDQEATVGDVKTQGSDLVEPAAEVTTTVDAIDAAKEALAAAQQELLDARAALAEAVATASSVPLSTVESTTSTTTTLVPQAAIEQVQAAQEALDDTAAGITDETPLSEATVEFNSAAVALEMSWLQLLGPAQCFTTEEQADAAAQMAAYTTALQTDLTNAGYDPGAIDGIYGPETVAAVKQLQTDAGLPVTGWVDAATERALRDKLDTQQAQQTVSVQTILKAAGYWDGPIDGVWTDELTQALMDFQTALGVPATGVVDPATIIAFQQALANLTAPPATTVPAPDTTAAPPAATVPPATTAPPVDTTTPPAAEPTVVVTDSATLGTQILTTSDGFTVYLLTDDAQGPPTCVDGCATAWPPLTIDDPAALLAGDGVDTALLATVDHPSGVTQVTYNGWPLYLFAGDADPGDTNGQGSDGIWFAVDPVGDAVPAG